MVRTLGICDEKNGTIVSHLEQKLITCVSFV